ncbi:hypothetical protein MRM75_06360 [bacterium 19CA06SA08-2]|uniref:Uncharacterized protein n=1 Tax=bacterium 19CA06SA08-2 TaxID=2920658 RepID=A0AAU6UAD6_UNCXX
MLLNDKMLMLSILVLAAVTQGAKASEQVGSYLDANINVPNQSDADTTTLAEVSSSGFIQLDHDGDWLAIMDTYVLSPAEYSMYAPMLVAGGEHVDNPVVNLLFALAPGIWL